MALRQVGVRRPEGHKLVKKRNLAAGMTPGENWRCANDNHQSNIGFPLASSFERRYC
jgi:hypothetical protein